LKLVVGLPGVVRVPDCEPEKLALDCIPVE